MTVSLGPTRRAAAVGATVLLGLVGAVVAYGPATAAPGRNLGVADADGEHADLIARTHTKDSDPGRVSSSFFVDGVLADANGVPVSNVEVQVDLQPGPKLMVATEDANEEEAAEEDDEIGAVLPDGAAPPAPSVPLGRAVTNSQGQFKVSIPALKNISDYLDEDGLAELLISSLEGDDPVLYNVMVELPKVPGRRAIAPRADKWRVAPDVPTVQLLKRVRSRSASLESDTSEVGRIPLGGLILTGADSADAPAGIKKSSRVAGVDPEKACLKTQGTHAWGWKWTKAGKKRVMTPVQGLMTLDRTNVSYSWTETKTIEVTAGFDIKYEKAKLKGGFVKSKEQGQGGSVSRPDNFTGYAREAMEYRWQKLYCYKPKGHYGGVRQWRPYKALGGSDWEGDITAIHSCSTKYEYTPISPGGEAWVSRKSTSKYSQGLEVETSAGSLSLDSSQQNSTENKLMFKGVGGGRTFLCGRTGTVTESDRVREIRES